MKRKVKAWALLKRSNCINMCEGAYKDALCIHKTKITDEMVPCTITYTLPTKERKRKQPKS